MGLSPSTLFHLTSKTGLKGILKDNFKLKYCLEKIDHTEMPVELAIPMVAFCDIKISEIKDHIDKYGSYGIGFDPTDVGASDKFFDLANTERNPPNNQTFTVAGL